ncbi:CvpA family protein [Brevundimonas lutea]|uniref:CvpA family protein n=1 Tax=Brevundimonas lutea TaxID=2293980 RepID=UPI000F023FF2|nr:CvpA family protein [Brevundimonas lutea]
MTGYDVFALIVVLLSAGSGWLRGGVREIVTLFSFVLAAILALIALPVTGPLARGLIEPAWAGSIAAVVVVFLIIYFVIRSVGALASKSLRGAGGLGVVDRIAGVAIGTLRAVVLLGVVHLVVVAATPAERLPGWFTGAVVQPVGAASARTIQAVLPDIGRGMDRLTPVVEDSVRRGLSDDPQADEALPQPQSETTSPDVPTS